MKGIFVCNIEHKDGRKETVLVDKDDIKVRPVLMHPMVNSAVWEAYGRPSKIDISLVPMTPFKEIQEKAK